MNVARVDDTQPPQVITVKLRPNLSKVLRLGAILCLGVVHSGCTLEQMYPGPPRPVSEVAWIEETPPQFLFPGLSAKCGTTILSVNGTERDVVRFNAPFFYMARDTLEILTGKTEVLVATDFPAPYLERKWLRFDAKPDRAYRALCRRINHKRSFYCVFWIEDAETGQVIAGRRPDDDKS